jgi:hypothetical protein
MAAAEGLFYFKAKRPEAQIMQPQALFKFLGCLGQALCSGALAKCFGQVP